MFGVSNFTVLDMLKVGSESSQNEDLVVPPPLGPELASGKWKVYVIGL